MKLWFEFLGAVGVGWAEVSVDDVARFVSWLRAPATSVIVLDGGTARRSPSTVNRHLAAVFGFYEHHARSGRQGRGRVGGMAADRPWFLQAVPASRHRQPADRHPSGEAAGPAASTAHAERTLHMLRHTHATELIRSGVAIDVVARLLTHRSSVTTSQIYVHLRRRRRARSPAPGRRLGLAAYS